MEQKIIDILNGYVEHFPGEAGECIPTAAIPDIAGEIQQALQVANVSGSVPEAENKYHFAREVLFNLRSCYAISDTVYLHWIDKLISDEKLGGTDR